MHIVHTIAELREKLSGYKCPAFVPTMGNLHDGHIALVKEAKPLGDVTVSSIFVNRCSLRRTKTLTATRARWRPMRSG